MQDYQRFYNYGWDQSLREKWAENSYERYFQKIDVESTFKIITNTFLSSILDELSSKNISTEQFKQTTTTIINQGVMVSGGEVKAENMTIGKGSSIKNSFTKK